MFSGTAYEGTNTAPGRARLGGRKWLLSLLFGLALTGYSSYGSFCFAGPETDPNLPKLEQKFFEHTYAKDPIDSRLERLEKMVFGEAKTGDAATRLSNLIGAVPNLNSSPPADSTANSGQGQDSGSPPQASSGSGRTAASDSGDTDEPRPATQPGRNKTAQSPARSPERYDEDPAETTTQYPAVSAIEKRLLSKDFQGEPLAKRIDRLEMKVYGKTNPTNSDDLSERLDRIKQKTGVDLAKVAPPGTDWADDDDMPAHGNGEMTYIPAQTTPYSDSGDEDGKSFSGRNLRKDMQQAFGRPATSSWYGQGGTGTSGPSGTYGSPTISHAPPSAGPSGSFGMGGGSGGMPPVAPSRGADGTIQPGSMGLSQEVSLLENELFRKTFVNETIPNRLNRLEGIVFPGQRPPSDMSLPDRVNRILSAVPISEPSVAQAPRRSVAQAPRQDADDLDPQMPPTAPQRTGGGLSKIINGLGNLLGGGGGVYGAAPYASNLVTDPTTGLLYDRVSGNYIDPNTGMVIPRGGTGMPVPVTPGYGYGGSPYGYNRGYAGFNNGLSPIGSPYNSYGSGMHFGFGGSGIRFGGTGMGMGGLPGGGMIGPGVGVWP